ncbi:MAG: rod shape-determining protein [Candidatus Cloacimonadota bacterium]|nr:MAG: rod shape-determining protein [Candidatus Cloacimonadota bacterium]PIE77769.1 MAG: rod shape-determining protein [Candidatus Delongbacteria bacterium]
MMGLFSFLNIFSNDIAIDLGTANTLIWVKSRGIVVEEPSVVTWDNRLKKVIAIGREARSMEGKTPGEIRTIRPMRDGVIDDDEIAEEMIRQFIRLVKNRTLAGRPKMVVCVPSGVTKSEKRIIRSAAENAGAREVNLVSEPMAAALGVGLPVDQSEGSMVVDIGGGTTEIAVISLSGIVSENSIRTAGEKMNNAIMEFMRSEHKLSIGAKTAEQIKIQIGSAIELKQEDSMTIKGKDLIGGLPKEMVVHSEEVRKTLEPVINQIVQAVRSALEKTPAELASDIKDRGIVLTGGGALLRGLDEKLRNETNLPVSLADDPLTCVVRGTGKIIEDMNRYYKVLLND